MALAAAGANRLQSDGAVALLHSGLVPEFQAVATRPELFPQLLIVTLPSAIFVTFAVYLLYYCYLELRR